MRPFVRLAMLSAFTCALSLPAQQSAVLTVQADKPLHAVSPMLYGLMTEEINYSYDGGLYAEMVRNRTFEKNWMGIQYWMLDNAGDSHASLKWDDSTGPSEAVGSSVAVTVDAADAAHPAGLRNDGWWGMALQPNTTYTGSFYAKGDSLDTVGVSLVHNGSGKTVASTTVSAINGDWKQYTFTLKTGDVKASKDNHLLLTFPKAGKVSLSLVSLFPPTYKGRANGNRTDLMEMMAGLHPKFLRMPGGNYLEGDQIDQRFDWKTTIGPIADRPTHRGPWSYQSSDGLGLLEFLEWTEDLKIEPVLAVYAGYSLKGDFVHAGPAMQPFVDDALDEIEFVIGDTSTKWGAVRAKLGHPAPFPLHYVEVGNEDDLDHSGSYETRFPQFNTAIKKKYPQLQVIATAHVKRGQPDVIDDHYYKRAEDFYAMVDRYDNMPRTGAKIFVGEWATREGFPTTDMGAALGDAAWMTGMERNSDLIVMSAYAPMLVNVNPGGMQWESNLIGYDAATSYGSPSYYAQSIFAEFLGTDVPTSAITGANKRFFYSVTRDASKLYLKVVNASTEPQALDVKIDGATIAGEATLTTLHANNRADTNTLTDPKHIVPVTSKLRAAAATHRTVPPLTIEVITLPLK
ncbi:alpha-L-arabinofuranosidase [Terriglobus roseus DSM 18391]|uniref:non-reducing end alpha-L-arabinofuranosidase n=1 Tax=Terriglobus roseus (strain DSM 18391 / NRRL B-41598 / KBS 63) TaxID=926566 RepID=I3ZMX8_TERRK|nr:alpha-L-arabinofuranosidase C-terminal domain-containing protein [Terriglobus roseus]AFL90596.1 alpha-L-arabinofuranosidase [Terriglobus roseus DSM 18391]